MVPFASWQLQLLMLPGIGGEKDSLENIKQVGG